MLRKSHSTAILYCLHKLLSADFRTRGEVIQQNSTGLSKNIYKVLFNEVIQQEYGSVQKYIQISL